MSADELPPSSKRQRRPQLSAEDKALWDHVAGSVFKIRRAKPRLPEISASGANDEFKEAMNHLEQRLKNEASRTGPLPAKPSDKAASMVGAARSAQPHPHVSHPTRQKTPPLADFDRKAVRRIRSGRIEIEARIDLHGMRQDEAHRALRSFLTGCQARGLRWVLVITGKGRAQSDGDRVSTPFYESDERGVLRRSVPRWLAEPDLRHMVVSYTTAALHHGGEGALYIRLRGPRAEHHR